MPFTETVSSSFQNTTKTTSACWPICILVLYTVRALCAISPSVFFYPWSINYTQRHVDVERSKHIEIDQGWNLYAPVVFSCRIITFLPDEFENQNWPLIVLHQECGHVLNQRSSSSPARKLHVLSIEMCFWTRERNSINFWHKPPLCEKLGLKKLNIWWYLRTKFISSLLLEKVRISVRAPCVSWFRPETSGLSHPPGYGCTPPIAKVLPPHQSVMWGISASE